MQQHAKRVRLGEIMKIAVIDYVLYNVYKKKKKKKKNLQKY